MNISRNDPFDLDLCIRGLGVLLTHLHSDAYEYLYYFTFKRTMKSYAKEFNHAWEVSIDHDSFFEGSDDPFVVNCRKVQHKLIDCKQQLLLRFGIDEDEDLNNWSMILEARRFRPYILVHKRNKSYKKLKLHYERALSGYIESLYLYACALTVQSYKIPLLFKRQFTSQEALPLRLLNKDDANVDLLIGLITGLKKDFYDLRLLALHVLARSSNK
jgi:hypothetical protein